MGVTLHNGSLSGTRPFCTGPDPDEEFWSATYNLGGFWGTNVPSAAAPYPDTNIASDACSTNSVELGVGFPRVLAEDTWYLLFADLLVGDLAGSPASAAVSMVSNDCNDFGLDPHTDCMGLNTNRQPPSGFEKVQSYVNIDRNWSVPGCAVMADGFEAPVFIPSGSTDCPSAVTET